MGVHEVPPHPLAPHDESTDSITQALSGTHLPSEPVNPPTTVAAYAPPFSHTYDSQTRFTLGRASLVSPPTSLSPPSSCPHHSKPDGERGTNYFFSFDEDETSFERKHKAYVSAKSTRTASSSARSSTSESEKIIAPSRGHRRSHPYKHPNHSRNFQRQDGARLINKASEFQCPVVGCDHTQKNRRIPDSKRHVVTHERWIDPEKWTCCGVGMEKADWYGQGNTVGMEKEEQIKAGAYEFKGKLMIGGCLNTFSRRDALKRNVDNPEILCVGDLDSYFY